MNMNYIDGCEQDILQKYQISQLEVMVKQYELDPFFRINAKMTILGLGIDQAILDNPEQLDEQTLTSLLANEALASSLGLIFLSGLFVFFTSIVVQIIFPAQRSKSFEEGNKRVAPKGPETPAP